MTILLKKPTTSQANIPDIFLPENKSIINRILLLSAYAGEPIIKHYDKESEDTALMEILLRKLALHTNKNQVFTVDCDNAGSVLRFLGYYVAFKGGKYLLTGSKRMQQRPLSGMDKMLQTLGAKVTPAGAQGFPPVFIESEGLKGGTIEITNYTSGQPISGALMVAPLLKDGLVIQYDNPLPGTPYIQLTIALMRKAGIQITEAQNKIIVKPGQYNIEETTVEKDWSAAAFWYEYAAMAAKNTTIRLPGLSHASIQGDKITSQLFEKLGVSSFETSDAIIVKNIGRVNNSVEADFYHYPDLFPAFLTACAALNIRARLTGVQNLKHKESNRIITMTQQLQSVGFGIDIVSANETRTTGTNHLKKGHWKFVSYDDHRIAMALAPLALIHNVSIANESVVKKSYPGFWQECRKLFNVSLTEK